MEAINAALAQRANRFSSNPWQTWHLRRRSRIPVLERLVSDGVVVAFVRDVDMAAYLGVRRVVEGAHGDFNGVSFQSVPEQKRAFEQKPRCAFSDERNQV